jgi:transglutaminase-like putative cysteine protease
LTADLATRHVGSRLTFRLETETTLALQVAPATTVGTIDEDLAVTLDEATVDDVSVVPTDHGGRLHVVRAGEGTLLVDYEALIQPVEADLVEEDPGWDAEGVRYLLQSRYCPSDALGGFAQTELAGKSPTEVGQWVFGRLAYTLGLSTPLTTAIETLGAGAGACRDFAHLAVTMLRGIGIPARLVAVYAPGLSPMDFHAVVEARVDGRWQVVDPTRLAPRQSLVRIATGRDATDTAFATTLSGDAELVLMEVRAWTDGPLPRDDHSDVEALA